MAETAAPTIAEHLKDGFASTSDPTPNLHSSTGAFPNSAELSLQFASADPRISPAHEARPSNTLNRIYFSRSIGIKELAMEDVEKRGRAQKAEAKARKDAASRERTAQRDQEQRTREEQRKASKQQAKQNKTEKAERKAEEKRVKKYYGIRGYDPNAGILPADRESMAKTGGDGRPAASEKCRQLPHKESQAWGLEFGKPQRLEGRGHFSGYHENCGQLYRSSAAGHGH